MQIITTKQEPRYSDLGGLRAVSLGEHLAEIAERRGGGEFAVVALVPSSSSERYLFGGYDAYPVLAVASEDYNHGHHENESADEAAFSVTVRLVATNYRGDGELAARDRSADVRHVADCLLAAHEYNTAEITLDDERNGYVVIDAIFDYFARRVALICAGM